MPKSASQSFIADEFLCMKNPFLRPVVESIRLRKILCSRSCCPVGLSGIFCGVLAVLIDFSSAQWAWKV